MIFFLNAPTVSNFKLYNLGAINNPSSIVPKILYVSKKYERKSFRNLLGENNDRITGWRLKSEKGWISCDDPF